MLSAFVTSSGNALMPFAARPSRTATLRAVAITCNPLELSTFYCPLVNAVPTLMSSLTLGVEFQRQRVANPTGRAPAVRRVQRLDENATATKLTR